MALFNLELGKVKIPLYDIGTIAAGFYAGYWEGKGPDANASLEFLAKYGPTAVAITATPLMIKFTNSFGKFMNKLAKKSLDDGSLKVTLDNGDKKSIRHLAPAERQKISSKIQDRIRSLDAKLETVQYIKPTLIAGKRTAVETALGYIAGRIYSQINWVQFS